MNFCHFPDVFNVLTALSLWPLKRKDQPLAVIGVAFKPVYPCGGNPFVLAVFAVEPLAWGVSAGVNRGPVILATLAFSRTNQNTGVSRLNMSCAGAQAMLLKKSLIRTRATRKNILCLFFGALSRHIFTRYKRLRVNTKHQRSAATWPQKLVMPRRCYACKLQATHFPLQTAIMNHTNSR